MTPRQHGQRGYAFGEFTLDVDRGVLRRGEQEIRLRPKSFDVLRHLVAHAGVLVERQSLMDAVWGNTVVTEDSLTQCVVEIRRALDDRAQRIVRTVPRRGFIFDAEVHPAGQGVPSARLEHDGVVTRSRGGLPRKRVGAALAMLAILAGAAIAWWTLAQRDGQTGVGTPTTEPPPRSIAVLRFTDLSPQGDQQYFADGLAEEILHLLAQSPQLRITARSSSFAVEPGGNKADEIGRLLGVRHLLEGSVRRDGASLRVTIQLIDAMTGTHVWSRTYDRVFSSMLDLQSEIASQVAATLQVKLAERPHSRSPSAAEAHDAYLLGRHLFLRRGPGDLEAAERHFLHAVQLDPRHAQAWTALAGVYNVRALDELRDPTYRLEEQREALERALAIDPTLAEAHVRLARYFALTGRDAERRQAIEQARQLAPNDPLTLATLSYEASRDGRLEEAIGLDRRIVAADPLSAVYRGNLAYLLLGAGRYEEALAELRRAQALSPGLGQLDDQLALAYLLLGRVAEAREALGAADTPRHDQLRVLIGDSAEASAALQRMAKDHSARGRLLMAEIAAYQGDADAAFAHLEAARLALAERPAAFDFDLLQAVAISPLLRSVRDDPRWAGYRAAILAR